MHVTRAVEMNRFVMRAVSTGWRGGYVVGAIALAALFLASASCSVAQTAYYRHIFFDNGPRISTYYYSSGKAVEPSALEVLDKKLPLSSDVYFTPPNSVRISWRSNAGGTWAAQIKVLAIRDREILFEGDTLSFWLYSEEKIAALALPGLRLHDTNRGFSKEIRIGEFCGDIPAKKWTRVRIPLNRIKPESVTSFEVHRLNSMIFEQGAADSAAHTLFIDEVRIENAPSSTADSKSATPPPRNLQVRAYERHVDLGWDPEVHSKDESALGRFIVYRSFDGSNFQPIGMQTPGVYRYTDFLGKMGQKAYYKVVASDANYRESAPSDIASATTHSMTDDELLTMLQEACFRYYWEGAHPDSGMIHENLPGNDRIVATGASGFGVMALVVGVERRFITRAQAVERLNTIATFLERAPRYHGAWSHFMDGSTGQSLPVFDVMDRVVKLVPQGRTIEEKPKIREPTRNGVRQVSQFISTGVFDILIRSRLNHTRYLIKDACQ